MLSLDSKVILLLCSHLGIAKDVDLAPLTVRQWNLMRQKILAASVQRLEALLGWGVGELQQRLDLQEGEALRIAELLSRGDSLNRELDRLAGLGIHAMTRIDEGYPERYHQRLKEAAPMVLFYAGEAALLGQPGVAVVGSRHLDAAGQECAVFVGNACGLSGLVLYSGGARGVDTLSMNAALEARGSAVAVLADSLEKSVRSPGLKQPLERGDLCLVSPYSPSAGFSVGAAMGRNRLIYCLADHAIVVASDVDKGGTWAGATEAIKNGWVPVFVLEHGAMPEGNMELLNRGGVPFPHPFPEHYSRLPGWLREHAGAADSKPTQLGLF